MARTIIHLPPAELEFQMFVLDQKCHEKAKKGMDVIRLTIGISELPEPRPVMDVLCEAIVDYHKTRQVHPIGLPELREKIASYYRQEYGAFFGADSVIVNTGTSAIFRNLLYLVTANGGRILMPKPFYSLYKMSAILAGAEIDYYEIDRDTQRLNLESVSSNFDPAKTSLVILNSPGNPIGNILSKEDVMAVYEIVGDNAFILHDEIYANTCFYERYQCPLGYVSERQKEISILTNGFSKGFRLYTKRVGFAVLPSDLIAPSRIVQQHTLLTHDPVNQYGMIEVLNHPQYPVELTTVYKARAEYAYESLSDTKCQVIKPRGGFYVVLDCENFILQRGFKSSIELAHDILDITGVGVVPGTDFGWPNSLRLSFCSARFEEGIDRLRRYFS